MARSLLLRAAFILSTLHGVAAHAETGGSVTLVSDYRFRGMSLSDGHAVPQFSIEYNSPSDWYAGAFVSPVVLKEGRDRAQLVTYAGYASRLNDKLSWEAGAVRSMFPGVADYSYNELYLGVSSDNLGGRLYLSPDYYSQGVRTLYAEGNGAYPLLPWLQLIGHAGYLFNLNDDASRTTSMPSRWDVRASLAARFDDWNVQVAWTVVQRALQMSATPSNGAAYGDGAAYGVSSTGVRSGDTHAVVLSISRSF